MTIRVAIVDDETELRQSIADYRNHANGFRCVQAHASAEEALRGLPVERPDVVLMDIKMAGDRRCRVGSRARWCSTSSGVRGRRR